MVPFVPLSELLYQKYTYDFLDLTEIKQFPAFYLQNYLVLTKQVMWTRHRHPHVESVSQMTVGNEPFLLRRMDD